MQIQQRIAAQRSPNVVTIISDEPPLQLARLCHELEQRGIEGIIQPANSPRRVGVAYIRSIDPWLGSGSSFAQIATLGARPAFMVNTPGSVRIAEWSPLATHALRDCGVPQPSRLWCLDEDDLPRTSAALGIPIAFEGVVTQRRAVASAPDELGRAFAHAVGSHPGRGAMAQVPIRDPASHVAIMVVDGVCIPLHGRQMRSISPLAGARAALVAAEAVAALGGSAMSVEITIDQSDNVYVTRVDPAPPIDRLNAAAVSALVSAIATRLAAVWPSHPRPRRMETDRAPLRVGHPC